MKNVLKFYIFDFKELCLCALSTAIILFVSGCTQRCVIQEIDDSGNAISVSENNCMQGNQIGYNPRFRRKTGYERYQEILKTIHKGNPGENCSNGSEDHVFKLRFCNYMLGYRKDSPEELINVAKTIAEGYKNMRLYEIARKFDSYRDVLMFGNETIAESWDDTIELLEEFQAKVIKKQKEEACKRRNEEKAKEPSFWSKLFGGGKKQELECSCNGVGREFYEDSVAVPTILVEPPGSCNYKSPLSYKRKTDNSCSVYQLCPVNGRTSTENYRDSVHSIDNDVKPYFRR